MSMTFRIIDNSAGSGDWVIFYLNGDVVYEGHDVSPHHLKNIFEAVMGYDKVHYHSMTDEQLENWSEHI